MFNHRTNCLYFIFIVRHWAVKLQNMFATKELVNHRKKEAKRLQNALFTKLAKVQKLAIKRILKGEDVVFEINSFAKSAILHSINGITCGNKYYQANLEHYAHMDFDYDNVICEYYENSIRWLIIGLRY